MFLPPTKKFGGVSAKVCTLILTNGSRRFIPKTGNEFALFFPSDRSLADTMLSIALSVPMAQCDGYAIAPFRFKTNLAMPSAPLVSPKTSPDSSKTKKLSPHSILTCSAAYPSCKPCLKLYRYRLRSLTIRNAVTSR